MCGIVLKTNFDGTPVNNAVLEQYDKQSHRGKKGFGLFSLHGEKPQIVREATEDNILKWLCTKDSPFIMFHHRLPTSTINVAKAAHPHSTGDYFGNTQYILVHNGVISNAAELFVKHQELGMEYHSLLTDLTFNDSESLLWDLAMVLEGHQERLQSRGNMAFICLKTVDGKLEQMYFGRNTNPLNMYCDKQTLELSSEGRGVAIEKNTLYKWTVETKQLTMRDMEFPQPIYFQAKNLPTTRVYNSAHRATAATEEERYDEYWRQRAAEQEPENNWERLRVKYAHLLKDSGKESARFSTQSGASRVAEVLTTGDHAYEASQNADGSFSVVPKPIKLDMDGIMENRKDFEPTPAEVQRRAMEYLVECRGVFENAYALLEFEYEQFLEDMEMADQTFEDVREQLLMEAALEWINKDPEYVNENSVSSVAEAIYLQEEYAVHSSMNGGQLVLA